MEVSTINQIILTSGVVLVALITVVGSGLILIKVNRIKKTFISEKDLLRDILFLRTVIYWYGVHCKDELNKVMRQEFFETATEELGYNLSQQSYPSRIKKRLLELNIQIKDIDKVTERIQG